MKLLRQAKQAMRDTGVKIHDIELARILDDVDVSEARELLEVGAVASAAAYLGSFDLFHDKFSLL